MSKNNIIYIANSQFPNLSANNIHIWNMCHALHRSSSLDQVITRSNHPFESKNNYLNKCKKIFSTEPEFRHKRIKSLRGLKDLDFNFSLQSYLRKIDAKLVYTRALNTAFIAIDTPSIKALVLELHEPPRSHVEKAQFKYICTHKGLKKLVCITHALKSHICHHFQLPDTLVDVLPDCASPIEFSQKDSRSLDKKYFGTNLDVSYVGHLYEGRADILISIAKELSHSTINIFGGTRKDILRYLSLLKQNNVENVCLHGHVKYPEARYVMKRSKILLMPYSDKVLTKMGTNSTNWMSPLKMYEYMLSKSLILTSDLPAIREVLDSNTSVLLNCNDHVAWARAIESGLLDFKSHAPTIERAYNLAKGLTWDDRARLIADYFHAD
jgi:hypothetical protein